MTELRIENYELRKRFDTYGKQHSMLENQGFLTDREVQWCQISNT